MFGWGRILLLRIFADGALVREGGPGICRNISVAIFLAASPFTFVTPAYGDELAEVVRTALASHPKVAASRAGFKASQYGIDEQRAGLLPSLDLSADTGYQHAHRRDGEATADDLWRNKQRLSLTQLLFDGGETANRYAAAKASSAAERYDFMASATQIARRAIGAYLDVARDRELIGAAMDNINFHRGILDDVNEAARQGGGAESRVAQVRTRLLNAQSQRRRLEANLRNSMADYIEAVGQAPGDTSRPEMPATVLPSSLNEAVAIAVKNNYDLLSSGRREEAASLTAESAKGSFYPTIDIELAHERRDNLDGTRGLEADSTALLRLTWELYGGGGDTATRRKALEQKYEARYQTQEVDRLLREELAVALNDYEAARDQVEILRDRVATAREVRTAYGQQFRLAQRTILDLLDSSNEQFVAETDLISMQYQRLRAAYDILATSGTLLKDLGIEANPEVAGGE